MDSADTFTEVLIVLGFTLLAQREELTNQGLTTGNDLCALTKAELNLVFDENRNSNRRRTLANQVTIPIIARTKLEALRYEFYLRVQCNSPMTEENLLNLTADDSRQLVLQKQTHEEARSNADVLPTVDVPKLIKGNWRSFRDAFTELLSRQVGSNGIPLTYIIRDSAVPGNYDDDYTTLNEKLINCIQHVGPKYVDDYKSVFSLLSTHLKDSEGETTTKRFNRSRNGRTCWLALRIHFESESYKSSMKTTAIANIRASEYNGPKKNFNLASLYLIHTKAHNMLEEAELPYSESQKIQEFQSCLKEKTSIEKSVSALSTLGFNPTFEQYYNTLNGQLTAIITLSDAALHTRNNRSISEVTTSSSRDSHNSGRGRGRFRGGRSGRGGRHGGRGRYNGKGGNPGRGRGRGTYNGNTRSQPYDSRNRSSWQPRLGPYDDDEWYGLTLAQKNRVWDLRNAAENHDNNRTVNQISFIDDLTAASNTQNNTLLPPPPQSIQVPPPAQTQNNTNPHTSSNASRGSAGSAFNRNNNNQTNRRYN